LCGERAQGLLDGPGIINVTDDSVIFCFSLVKKADFFFLKKEKYLPGPVI
jgi:hypothetical protein